MREIKICMGSACFIKGNNENLEFIKRFISENSLEDKVTCIGTLCENKCANGPRVIIDGIEYNNVTQELLVEILKK